MRTIRRLFRRRAIPGFLGVAAALTRRAFAVGDIQSLWTFFLPDKAGLADYGVLAVMVLGVLLMVHVARDPVKPSDELAMHWLGERLKEVYEPRWMPWGERRRLFTDGDVEAQLDQCYASLRDQAIFSKSEAHRLLKSRWLYRHLSRLYSETMGRPNDALWDVSGYTHWGAMIWRASWIERPEVLRYVKSRMEVWRERGAR